MKKLDGIDALTALLSKWIVEKSASPSAIQTLRDLIKQMEDEADRKALQEIVDRSKADET